MNDKLNSRIVNGFILCMLYLVVTLAKTAKLYFMYMAICALKDVIHPVIILFAIMDYYIEIYIKHISLQD